MLAEGQGNARRKKQRPCDDAGHYALSRIPLVTRRASSLSDLDGTAHIPSAGSKMQSALREGRVEVEKWVTMNEVVGEMEESVASTATAETRTTIQPRPPLQT